MRERSHRLLYALILVAACNKPAAAPPDLATASSCKAATDCASACPPATLAECVEACASKITPASRPMWDALQNCSKTNCQDSCQPPTAMGCKLCVMGHCAGQVTACVSH